MHEKGADLPTIASQIGVNHLETLAKHYLTVVDSTIRKFI
jgi:hypothetical protein